jgi:hypothetical protein
MLSRLTRIEVNGRWIIKRYTHTCPHGCLSYSYRRYVRVLCLDIPYWFAGPLTIPK